MILIVIIATIIIIIIYHYDYREVNETWTEEANKYIHL